MCDMLPRQRTQDIARSERARGGVPEVRVGGADLVAREGHGPRRDGIDRREETEVHVGRAGVARVPARADDIAAPHVLPDGHAHGAGAKMTQLGVFAWRMLDDDEVALVASL